MLLRCIGYKLIVVILGEFCLSILQLTRYGEAKLYTSLHSKSRSNIVVEQQRNIDYVQLCRQIVQSDIRINIARLRCLLVDIAIIATLLGIMGTQHDRQRLCQLIVQVNTNGKSRLVARRTPRSRTASCIEINAIARKIGQTHSHTGNNRKLARSSLCRRSNTAHHNEK